MHSHQRLLEHLASLHLDLFEKRVLFLGDNQGELPAFYTDRGCSVVVLPQSASVQGQFDIVHCSGLPKNIKHAGNFISSLCQSCGVLLILDCKVFERNQEDDDNDFESCHSRSDVFSVLNSGFPYVYLTTAQPSHPDYPLDWTGSPKVIGRALFVASHSSMDSNPFLCSSLVQTQSHYSPSIATGLAALQETNTLLSQQLIQTEMALKGDLSYLHRESGRALSPYDKLTAADRVRRHLSFRLGAAMLDHSKSIIGWLTMVPALVWQFIEYRRDIKHLRDLPPLSSYPDAHEAERVRQFLSYRLGNVMLRHLRSPWGWLRMPWALRKEIASFREARSGAEIKVANSRIEQNSK